MVGTIGWHQATVLALHLNRHSHNLHNIHNLFGSCNSSFPFLSKGCSSSIITFRHLRAFSRQLVYCFLHVNLHALAGNHLHLIPSMHSCIDCCLQQRAHFNPAFLMLFRPSDIVAELAQTSKDRPEVGKTLWQWLCQSS